MLRTFREMTTLAQVSDMRALARQKGLANGASISLRALLTLATPTIRLTTRTFTIRDSITLNDLTLKTMSLSVSSDGTYAFSGTLYDDGTIWGDSYTVTMQVHQPGQDAILALTANGSVDDDRNGSWNQQGESDTLRDRWTDVEAALIDGTFQQSPDSPQFSFSIGY